MAPQQRNRIAQSTRYRLLNDEPMPLTVTPSERGGAWPTRGVHLTAGKGCLKVLTATALEE